MENSLKEDSLTIPKNVAERTIFPILLTISFSHLLNDTIQSLIPSIYPLVKESFRLSFTQIGLITLTFQLAASLLQPFVAKVEERKLARLNEVFNLCI